MLLKRIDGLSGRYPTDAFLYVKIPWCMGKRVCSRGVHWVRCYFLWDCMRLSSPSQLTRISRDLADLVPRRGTLIGPLTLLEKILAKLTPSLDAVHLQVNLSKTVIFTTGSVDNFPFLSKFTRIYTSDETIGVKVLGTPLGW